MKSNVSVGNVKVGDITPGGATVVSVAKDISEPWRYWVHMVDSEGTSQLALVDGHTFIKVTREDSDVNHKECPECGAPTTYDSTYEPMNDGMLIVNWTECISCPWMDDRSRMAEPGEEL